MNRVVEILMKRDGISREEAEQLVDLTREELTNAAADGDFEDPTEIIANNLGLEPDYILDILF